MMSSSFLCSRLLVGSFCSSKGSLDHNDHRCWMRPEDMEYMRSPLRCFSECTSLAGEVAAALASASIFFKDDAHEETLLTKDFHKFNYIVV
ncbi:unnamed protein product [Microthlaspi erraticum]|uniref:cellulase n=1 Tax=Microthlaspi erraticum TaxID=1685480 RepID=A0A6D2L0R9_9BRAS|nr:unnamed protein product [Microthlaspi erraticum]